MKLQLVIDALQKLCDNDPKVRCRSITWEGGFATIVIEGLPYHYPMRGGLFGNEFMTDENGVVE